MIQNITSCHEFSFLSRSLSLSLSLPLSLSPDLNFSELVTVVADVVFLQHSTPVVVEINTDLFSAVNPVASQYRVATCGDPHSSQGIGVNLIGLYQTSAVVMLEEEENR